MCCYANVHWLFLCLRNARTVSYDAYIELCNFVPVFDSYMSPPCVQDCCCFPWGGKFILPRPMMSANNVWLQRRLTGTNVLLCLIPTMRIANIVAFSLFFSGFRYCADCRDTHCDKSEPPRDYMDTSSRVPPPAPASQQASSNSAPVLPSAACTSFFLVLLPSFPHICVN